MARGAAIFEQGLAQHNTERENAFKVVYSRVEEAL